MRIIDIFNKIANGEELPKKFKYGGATFELEGNGVSYTDQDGDNLIGYICHDSSNLNDEIEIVEVVEEKPEPIEHIYTGDRYLFASKDNGMTKEDRKQLDSYFRVLLLSHDVLVNAVNYLLEKDNNE